MFYQIIYDASGKVINVHRFGWISESTFVSRLKATRCRIVTAEQLEKLTKGAA